MSSLPGVFLDFLMNMLKRLKSFSGKKYPIERGVSSGETRANGCVLIRSYSCTDRRDVLRIAEESFSGVSLDENIERRFEKTGKSWVEHKKDAVDYDLQHNPSLTLVAEIDGKAVGFVCSRMYPRRSTGHITNLAVDKQFRGRGVGRALVEETMELLSQEGAGYVRIETLDQNETGRRFYPSIGFEEIGRQIFYMKRL